MGIFASEASYENPKPGEDRPVVCCDVVDLGIVTPKDPKFKPAHKVRFVFQMDELNSKGNRFTVRSKPYTLSLHERSSLRKDLLKDWGVKLGPKELQKFDLESLSGRMAEVDLISVPVGDKVFVNIDSLRRYKGDVDLTVENYTRVKDRDKDAEDMIPSDQGEADADVPF